MEIKTASIQTTNASTTKTSTVSSKETSAKFSEELNGLKKNKEAETKQTSETEKAKDVQDETDTKKEQKNPEKTEECDIEKSLEELNSVVEKLNQPDEKNKNKLKKPNLTDDNTNKGNQVINNDFSIQENKDLMGQMNPNMNFSGDGQPFSSFMNNSQNQNLSSSASDLEEESAILSTMAENIAMANKNTMLNSTDNIKKSNPSTKINQENIVKFDAIIMNQADVEVFANIVETGSADLNNLAPEAAQKSVQVSKTLADMLAKAKETSQPLRIDFDNDISIIIRISRDGKLSADFLPSSQVAEAYLKENLPLLKQRFDENNIDYEELNHRERREQKEDTNKKKGRENE